MININSYRIVSSPIEMISDRLVTLQPHGGMPKGHASFMGLRRDVIDGIGSDGSTELLDAHSGVYAMRTKRTITKLNLQSQR